MEYPVYVPGMPDGTLYVSREGLYTVLEARLPYHPQLLRLWLYGGGESACLGVLQPSAGQLYLRRRLSRRELEKLPQNIEFAACYPPEEAPQEVREEAPPVEEAPAEVQEETPLEKAAAEKAAPQKALPESPKAEELEPVEPESQSLECLGELEPESQSPACLEELLWFSRPDGSLSAFDGRSSLVALPAKLRSPAPAGRILRREGREYMVFRY